MLSNAKHLMYTCKVVSGHGRGKELGFPTLNLEMPEKFSAKEGIYACKITIEGKIFAGALHFGPIPFFGENERSLEIFVLDWAGMEQPETVSFELGKYLRPIQNFDTPAALSAQIAQDVAKIRKSA